MTKCILVVQLERKHFLALAKLFEERGGDHLESHKGVQFEPTLVDEFFRLIQTEVVEGATTMRIPDMNATLLRKTLPFG